MPCPIRFNPEKTRYPLYMWLGRTQGRSGWVRKISPPPGFDPQSVQPIASHYTDWAIAAQSQWFNPYNTTIWVCLSFGQEQFYNTIHTVVTTCTDILNRTVPTACHLYIFDNWRSKVISIYTALLHVMRCDKQNPKDTNDTSFIAESHATD
jgi:hypothetical protein